ncbi:hypothetical protein Tco_1317907 [Tanacetum coccineum]
MSQSHVKSEGISTKVCDVPLCENNTPLNALNEHSEIVVNSDDDNSLSDDDSPYGEDIDYVDASPPDVEIVSLEVVEIVDRRKGLVGVASPTYHSELSSSDFKAFYVIDHFKEKILKSSGISITHVDFSRYDSLSLIFEHDQFPPADRSDLYHEEFTDELTKNQSLPTIECFQF